MNITFTSEHYFLTLSWGALCRLWTPPTSPPALDPLQCLGFYLFFSQFLLFILLDENRPFLQPSQEGCLSMFPKTKASVFHNHG